jgi:phosphopantothenoylcysteine decarboxylase/phosphopantothenate--cysteine ligase
MARAAAQLGAKVILISTIKPNFEDSRVTFIEVESAMEMLSAVQTHHSNIDISILAAAVADKRPKEFRAEKIKKNALANIELVENPDIAKWIGEHKGQSEKVLLFAAETDDAAEQFAIEKLAAKNGDLIYLNRVDREIFGSEESEGIAIYPDGRKIAIARNSKAQIANQLMQALLQG